MVWFSAFDTYWEGSFFMFLIWGGFLLFFPTSLCKAVKALGVKELRVNDDGKRQDLGSSKDNG
jgi:hypothetical protein